LTWGADSSAMLILILGGARSGKSRFAQSLRPKESPAVYLATCRVEDEEMRRRVERHQAERSPNWITVEEPLALAHAVQARCGEASFLLIDCLTLWLSNFCWEHRETPEAELERLACAEVEALAASSRDRRMVIVSNEVGSGIVPDHALGRRFRDLQGFVNQRAAALADQVFLTVAGIPLQLKPSAAHREGTT